MLKRTMLPPPPSDPLAFVTDWYLPRAARIGATVLPITMFASTSSPEAKGDDRPTVAPGRLRAAR